MKKAIAILLLSIHLYNSGGYMAIFQYFIYQANKFEESQISRDMYDSSKLVEIKIPINLPGAGTDQDYYPVSGSVQLKNNAYNYVRMKLTKDTLFVMCIPNCKTTRLIKANVILARDVSDTPLNAKKHDSPVKGNFNAKYISVAEVLTIAAINFHYPTQFFVRTPQLTLGIHTLVSEPPEHLLS